MASGENELIDVSDDDDCFSFKPSSNDNVVNCWGSNNFDDLEITSPIKEVTSPVTEVTNPVSELTPVEGDLLNMTITKDSEAQLNLDSVINDQAVVSESEVSEVKAELSYSDGLLINTEENGELESIVVINVSLKQEPDVDLKQEQSGDLKSNLESNLDLELDVDVKPEPDMILEPEPIEKEIIDDEDVKKELVIDDSDVNKNEFMETTETVICDTLNAESRSDTGLKVKKKRKKKTSENVNEKEKKLSQSFDGTRNTTAVSKIGKGNKYLTSAVETPLQLGWKREIVHRATFSGNKRIADCYYTSPTGKRLRSMVEVQQYLHLTSDTSVALEMFSYYKQRITDNVNETERHAKKADKRVAEDSLPLETPKQKKSKSSEEVHMKAHSSEVLPKQRRKEGRKGLAKSPSIHRSNNNNNISDLNPICNGFCEGYVGQLPDMNCVSCFCLFHPKCVGIFSSEEASDFICKNCLLQQTGVDLKLKSTKNRESNVSENKLQKVQVKQHQRKTIESHSLRESQIVPKVSCTSPSDSVKKKLKVYEHQRTVNSSPSKNINLVPFPNLSPSSNIPTTNTNPIPFPNLSPTSTAPSRSTASSTHSLVPPICINPISEKSHAMDVKPSLDHLVINPNISITPLRTNDEQQNDYNYWTCTLPKEANALAHVFSYLHTKDLFKMKLVCSTWNTVATRPFLWKHLYLQGLMVTNWNLLADFIEAKNVEMLNMRGMKMNKDVGEVWKQFNSILPKLTNIKELTLCKVPASIPYRLATKLENLTHFASEEIFDSKVDPSRGCKLYIGKFNKLKELKRLKLSGFKGLFIPKSVISEEFLNTDALKNLKHLSLTTFTGTKPSELESLTLLPNLSVLELGNCADWTDDHYLRIGLLTKLKKLRLEYGGTNESPVLCEVLKKLTELQTLELVLFPIPTSFVQVLSSLKHLQLLTVWPTEGATNSYRLTMALKTMSRLKKFVWGLVASELVKEAAIRKKMDDKVRCIPYFAEQSIGRGKMKWTEVKICANDLMEKLREILPATIIRVVIVSSDSYSSIRQASANK